MDVDMILDIKIVCSECDEELRITQINRGWSPKLAVDPCECQKSTTEEVKT